MKSIHCLSLGLILLALSPGHAHAQLRLDNYSFGLRLGTFVYQGDLTPSPIGSFRTPSFSWGLSVARKLRGPFSTRLDLNSGGLRGNDAAYSTPAWRQQRAFRFGGRVREVAGLLVYEPLSSRRLQPYALGGIGLASLRIEPDFSRFNEAYFPGEDLGNRLKEDQARTPPRTLLVLPVGAGLKYALSPKFSLTAEGSYRLMHSDYLDGVSQAANPKQGDHYLQVSLGIWYSPNRKGEIGCPVW